MAINVRYLSQSLKLRVTFFSLVIFWAAIWSLTYYAGLMLRSDLRRLLGEQQFSVASIVAAEVNQELDFRLRALERVSSGITPAAFARPEKLQVSLENRPVLRSLFNGGFFAIGTDGTAIADVPRTTGRIGMNVSERSWLQAALQGKAAVGDPVIGPRLQVPVFTLAVPVRAPSGEVIGVLAGVVDLSRPNFLDKITENHYGNTGDYLLVAPQARLVVTSSDRKRIMQPLPGVGINPAIDRNIHGFEGYTVLVNPFGVEQLASMKKIPAAGWYLAVALPTAEAFAPINAMKQRIQLAAVILTILAGGLTWLTLRRQLSPMLAAVETLSTLASSDLPVTPLPVARQDEVGQLIGAFNHLLETLELRARKLAESEERHRTILRTAINGIWLTDLHGRLLEVNESYCRMSGYSRQELVGMHISGLGAQESPDDVLARLQTIKDSTEVRFETRHRRKDGTLMDLEVSVQYQPADGGQFVSFLQDITKRKKAEEKLLKATQRLQLATRSARLGIWDWNVQENTMVWDERMLELYGLTAESFPGGIEAWQNGLHPEDREQTMEECRQALTGEKEWDTDFRVLHPDGTVKHVKANGIVIRDAAGAPVRMLGVNLDITDGKQAEERIARALKEKTVMLQEIHHRVKNNMQVISSLLNLQAAGIDDEAVRAKFDESRRRVSSMALIHERLYRAEDLAHVDFREYLQSLVGEISDTFRRPDVQVFVDMDPVALDVNVGVPCGLIINELVSNSLKYAFPEGRAGSVRVGIVPDREDNYVLFVEDDGIGLSSAVDFRNTSSLGFQLVSGLAHQLRGKVRLETAGGTRFSVIFPHKPGTREKRHG